MTDYFAVLDVTRRPWVDEESLKARFLEASAEAHPDRVHEAGETEKQRANERFAELNAAYTCLREPKTRLAHLFELETGARPKEVEQILPGTMELFMEVGQLCRQVDAFLAERAKVSSPVLKVEIFERAQEWTEKLNALQRKLNSRRQGLMAELREMNAAWEAALAGGPGRAVSLPLAQVEKAGREFSYVGRWSAQVQERIVQLAF